jgi:membrane associated rhomboid family serine protease
MGMGILTGLLSCVARKQFNSQSTVSIGASGVLYALFGIYIGMLIRVVGLIPAVTMSFSSLLPIIIISFIPGIDVYAHISGLLVGICTGFFM